MTEEKITRIHTIKHRINKHKQKIRDAILLDIIVIVIIFFWGYGYMLERAGYEYPVKGATSTFALAVDQVYAGVFPWNYIVEESKESGYVVENSLEEKYEKAEINVDFLHNSTNLSIEELNVKESSFLNPEEKEEFINVQNAMDNQMADGTYTFVTVDDSYFDDAVFLGDSRMVGVSAYANMPNATYYAKTSLTIYGLMDSAPTTDPTVMSVRQGLTNRQFGKVYIMVGINEIGTGDTEYFINHYQAVIDEIRELQPDAIIFIQGILHVSYARSSVDMYVNNNNINARNEALSELADNIDIFYIDVNPVFDDENGDLNQEYTFDNVHLTANEYAAWHQFYLEHGIVK